MRVSVMPAATILCVARVALLPLTPHEPRHRHLRLCADAKVVCLKWVTPKATSPRRRNLSIRKLLRLRN